MKSPLQDQMALRKTYITMLGLWLSNLGIRIGKKNERRLQ